MLAVEAGSPAGTVDVVKAIVAKMGGDREAPGLQKAGERAADAEKSEGGQATAGAGDRLAAETAAEVADSAKLLDKSKTSTPVPS